MLAGWATSNRVVDESMEVAKRVGCALKVSFLIENFVRDCLKAVKLGFL